MGYGNVMKFTEKHQSRKIRVTEKCSSNRSILQNNKSVRLHFRPWRTASRRQGKDGPAGGVAQQRGVGPGMTHGTGGLPDKMALRQYTTHRPPSSSISGGMAGIACLCLCLPRLFAALISSLRFFRIPLLIQISPHTFFLLFLLFPLLLMQFLHFFFQNLNHLSPSRPSPSSVIIALRSLIFSRLLHSSSIFIINSIMTVSQAGTQANAPSRPSFTVPRLHTLPGPLLLLTPPLPLLTSSLFL